MKMAADRNAEIEAELEEEGKIALQQERAMR